MEDYIYVCLKINKKTGEVSVMEKNIEQDKNIRREILDVYKKLNINSNSKKSFYSHYSELSNYNYEERTILDNSTYARI